MENNFTPSQDAYFDKMLGTSQQINQNSDMSVAKSNADRIRNIGTTAPTTTLSPEGGSLLARGAKALFKGVVQDPAKALIVRPALRFAGALASPIVSAFGDEGDKNRFQQLTSNPIDTPLGTVEGQKSGVSGAKQIAGEALESGTDIASMAIGGGQGANALTQPNTFIKGAIQGAKAGALTGGVFGAGQGTAKALQEDKSTGDIITSGLTGGAVGAITGGAIGGLTGGITGGIRGMKQRHDAIQQGLAAERQPTDVIQYSKDPTTGKISLDPVAKKALDEGIDPTDVQFIKNASPEDKKAFQDMYKIAEQASKDKTVTQQPVEVAGKSLVNRVKFLDSVRKDTGKELGSLAKSMEQTPLDITPTVDKLSSNLDDAGISIGKGGILDFSGSRYADQPAVQKQLQQVYSSIADGQLDPSKIISTRQRLFTNLNYAKAGNEIVPGDNADRILGEVYESLDDPLKVANPQYAELAKKYAQTSSAIRDFGNAIGKNFDLKDNLIDLRAGEVGQRILGNASAKPLALIQNISETAKGLGYTGTDNVRDQFLFSSMLQDPKLNLFEPTQTGSLRGQVGRGVMDTIKDFKGGLVSGTAKLAEKGLSAADGISPEGKRNAVQGLIGLGADKGINAPLAGSIEQLSENAAGWKPGMKVVFDTALNQKDGSKIQSMIDAGSVPAEYLKTFAKNIAKILKK